MDTLLPTETGCHFSLEKPEDQRSSKKQSEGLLIPWALLGGVEIGCSQS